MIDLIRSGVSIESFGTWVLIFVLIGYFLYKEWPEFRRRVSSRAVKEQKDEIDGETVEKRLDNIEKETKQVNEKLNRDYARLNLIEAQLEKAKASQTDEMEELEIIMQALLGILKGMQEHGMNGPTKDAEARITEYLTKKAHT